jgi:hypothetical protein
MLLDLKQPLQIFVIVMEELQLQGLVISQEETLMLHSLTLNGVLVN